MSKEKEFEVKALRGDKVITLPIRAANEEIAKALAARVLQRKSSKPAKVIDAKEKP